MRTGSTLHRILPKTATNLIAPLHHSRSIDILRGLGGFWSNRAFTKAFFKAANSKWQLPSLAIFMNIILSVLELQLISSMLSDILQVFFVLFISSVVSSASTGWSPSPYSFLTVTNHFWGFWWTNSRKMWRRLTVNASAKSTKSRQVRCSFLSPTSWSWPAKGNRGWPWGN